MSTTPEGRVKVLIDRWLKKWMPGCVVYKCPGGTFGKAGEPDYHICWHGFMIVIEAKADYNDPTGLQMKRLKEYQAAGAFAVVIRGYDMSRLEIIRQMILAKVAKLEKPEESHV